VFWHIRGRARVLVQRVRPQRLPAINTGKAVTGEVNRVLNIGCGPASRWIPDTDGVDMTDFGQKYVGDFLKMPIDGQYDAVICHHMVEHVPDTVALFNRIGDVLKPGGLLDIRVPTFPSSQAFQDPTHVKFIPNETFFAYFTDDSPAGHCYSRNTFKIIGWNRDRFLWELHVLMAKSEPNPQP
jgi:SAM-dependent methyltransferase